MKIGPIINDISTYIDILCSNHYLFSSKLFSMLTMLTNTHIYSQDNIIINREGLYTLYIFHQLHVILCLKYQHIIFL